MENIKKRTRNVPDQDPAQKTLKEKIKNAREIIKGKCEKSALPGRFLTYKVFFLP